MFNNGVLMLILFMNDAEYEYKKSGASFDNKTQPTLFWATTDAAASIARWLNLHLQSDDSNDTNRFSRVSRNTKHVEHLLPV